jgi:hypothetical protein
VTATGSFCTVKPGGGRQTRVPEFLSYRDNDPPRAKATTHGSLFKGCPPSCTLGGYEMADAGLGGDFSGDSKVDSAKPNYSAIVLRLILRLSKKYVLTL